MCMHTESFKGLDCGGARARTRILFCAKLVHYVLRTIKVCNTMRWNAVRLRAQSNGAAWGWALNISLA